MFAQPLAGQRIKALRQALKLSQREFGKNLGVSRDTISNYENGRVQPKEIFLDLACRIYGANRAYLIEGREPMLPKNTPGKDKEVEEAMRIIESLRPRMRPYAVRLIRGLLAMQEAENL